MPVILSRNHRRSSDRPPPCAAAYREDQARSAAQPPEFKLSARVLRMPHYAAMRPGEIVALTESDCTLPPNSPESVKEWGELLLGESCPEVGGGWTDDGTSYERRGLKRRKRGATQTVPIPPGSRTSAP